MAAPESDLKTFASFLKKERQPDFDIIVKAYRWSVHSHIISSHEFFGKLCSGAPEDGKRHEVHLDDDEPVIIAHLILWWYTKEYDTEAIYDIAGFDLESLMNYGMISPYFCSNALPALETETDNDGDIDRTNLSPISLHAKMYLIADKYDIMELREKAVYEISEILDAVKEDLLPCLIHFFVTNSSVDSPVDGDNGGIPPDKNIDASATGVTELWKILAETASKYFLSYRTDATFQQIITCDPRFHWDVMGRLASMLEAAQDKLASTPVEAPKTPKKRGKKKQENNSSSESARDKQKKKEKGGDAPAKKLKREPCMVNEQ
ncbi:uncharacterized protein Z519_04399 [Cladophialophora bantiana CBS 173.52]|uniref:BTB domain-containing protein n=1 Tax=Cladophialophora bantiana (strain ATCC 10958 / CBS 173.52 / CDC B-1940 / NIH 8579) TaxID=1442370 RepID=A0A0D2HM51_CLAB1|nr:uncharacterized protein Z519_04399 [Cladophialophora bantiana CBS 173.52]KIW94423.1 hypothetical protein Z519_04399 [Cladophialophora bantiana CBS 173.52]